MSGRPLDVPLDYPVYVERDILAQLHRILEQAAPAHRYALISDTQVASLHAASLLAQLPADRTRLFAIPPGEHEKTRARWGELTDEDIASEGDWALAAAGL